MLSVVLNILAVATSTTATDMNADCVYAQDRALFSRIECDRMENDGRPSSTEECSDDKGFIDWDLHSQFLQKEQELEDAERNVFQAMIEEMEFNESEMWIDSSAQAASQGVPKNKRKPRSAKSLRLYYFDTNGRLVHLKPRETLWHIVHCMNGREQPMRSKLFNKFRRRFRMPHQEFRQLLSEVQSHDLSQRWLSPDASGSPPSPIGLLLLGALRCLGRGSTFDDLEEFTALSEETHRQCFHKFIEYGEMVLFPKCVVMPTNPVDFHTHAKELTTGGLWGCGHSADATNVIMWRCQHNLKQANAGFKATHPARSYNICVNHRGRILHSTRGHPSRWNDKTLAWFDDFLYGIHKGTMLSDSQFDLLCWEDVPGKSMILREKHSGAWGLTDNGYHRWTTTQAPTKVNSLIAEQRLSDWIESFRKDVECVFGILKGRFRMLKTGIRVDGPISADRIWMTCCALHNWLLEVDGLDEEWGGVDGQNDASECRKFAPYAIRRLNNSQLWQSTA